MAPHEFSASALVGAPPQTAYAIIADYRDSHPLILPRPPFVALTVEQGGVGAGTVLFVQMRVLGMLQGFRSVVSEPEPGRVLVETNDTGYVTTFTVEPRAGGRQSEVTIATRLEGRAGLLAGLEAWLTARLLRPVYERELGMLAALAAERSAASVSGAQSA